MGLRARTDDLVKLREEKEREAAMQSATLLIFRKMAEAGNIEDNDIIAHAALFNLWAEDEAHAEGAIRRCPECGDIFRCIREPNARARSSKAAPSKAPENWASISEKVKLIQKSSTSVSE